MTRVGLLGFGFIGEALCREVREGRYPGLEMAFVWNRSADKLAGLPREVRLGPGRTGQLGVSLVTRREAAAFEGYKASELFKQVFGDAGAHARSAVGVAVLPLDAPVEVELIAEVRV